MSLMPRESCNFRYSVNLCAKSTQREETTVASEVDLNIRNVVLYPKIFLQQNALMTL